MGTTAQKLAAVASSKAKIDAALTARGITPPTKFADYGDAVRMLSKVWDAEVEYLQSTGEQWIDMGVGPTTGAIAFDYTISGYANNAGVFGQQITGNRVLLWIDSAASGYFDRGSSGSRISYSSADFSRTKTAYDASSTPAPRYLFTTATSSGSARTTRARVQLRYFQLWDENDVLVRDFIPVRVGTTGYLFDRVSGTLFGNEGTGAFTVGADKS